MLKAGQETKRNCSGGGHCIIERCTGGTNEGRIIEATDKTEIQINSKDSKYMTIESTEDNKTITVKDAKG